MSTTPDARRFQRLLDEDEEAGVGAVETAEKLFAELSERLSQRKRWRRGGTSSGRNFRGQMLFECD